MKDVKKFSLTLFLICIVAAGLLAFINKLTQPKIIAQAKAEEEQALKDVAPDAASFEEVKKNNQAVYFKALDNNKKIIGYCLLAKKYGYSSDIVTMVGIKPDGEITGIKILEQNETPGLGTKITGEFQDKFKSKNSLTVEVDTISGATISSKAVIDSVKEKAKEVLGELKK